VSGRDKLGESVEPQWLERRDALRAIEDWRLEGRLSLKAGRDGYNGTLSWEQAGGEIDFRFRGPFGFGGFRIHGAARITVNGVYLVEVAHADLKVDIGNCLIGRVVFGKILVGGGRLTVMTEVIMTVG
jgi:hypothetical protein